MMHILKLWQYPFTILVVAKFDAYYKHYYAVLVVNSGP
jgi:hypothetical protein